MENFLPFALPDIGEEEISEVVDSLRAGWLTTGPKTRRFEEDFSSLMEGAEAVAVNSATAGLHLALEALGIGPGDEVITTVYTFTATAEVVRYLGAEPVFVDVCEDTLNLDPAALEAAITSRTKAVIPVHFAGLACDMEAIGKIARKHGLAVVEDAAHSLPARYRGRLVGTLDSDAAVFSFYATKTITTGEGGMVVTRDARLAERCRIMRLHGIDRDAFKRYTAETPSWYYQIVAPGFKYNMTDMAASLGIHQLKKAVLFQEKRALMARRYREAFQDLPLVLPADSPSGDLHSWHLFVVRLLVETGIDRDAFIRSMAERKIGCSVHFIPLHLHPYWRERYGLVPEMFPRAHEAFARAVSLPLYTRMDARDQERVITAVREILA